MKGKIIKNWQDSNSSTHQNHIIFVPTGNSFDIKVVDETGAVRPYNPVGTVQENITTLTRDLNALKEKVSDSNKTDVESNKTKISTLEGKVQKLEENIGTWS